MDKQTFLEKFINQYDSSIYFIADEDFVTGNAECITIQVPEDEQSKVQAVLSNMQVNYYMRHIELFQGEEYNIKMLLIDVFVE